MSSCIRKKSFSFHCQQSKHIILCGIYSEIRNNFTDSYHHNHHHHLHHPYQHYERTATSLQLLANVTIVELSRACNTLYGGSFALAIACSSNKMNIILVCSIADYQRYFKFFFKGVYGGAFAKACFS